MIAHFAVRNPGGKNILWSSQLLTTIAVQTGDFIRTKKYTQVLARVYF
jgi:hypothetical protein